MFDPIEGPYAAPTTRLNLATVVVWHAADHYRPNGDLPTARRHRPARQPTKSTETSRDVNWLRVGAGTQHNYQVTPLTPVPSVGLRRAAEHPFVGCQSHIPMSGVEAALWFGSCRTWRRNRPRSGTARREVAEALLRTQGAPR